MSVTETEIIVVGAGAAGLMAAADLSATGKKVSVVEAQDHLGGRIHTLDDGLEAGAEFIHGMLPLSMGLLREAGIVPIEVEGNMIRVEKGNWKTGYENLDGYVKWVHELQALKKDTTVAVFMREHFPDKKYDGLKQMVKGFVEGYDAADIEKAGIMGIRDEWLEEDGPQYRIPGGYSRLIEHLVKKCRQNRAAIITGMPVKEVHWQKHRVIVICEGGQTFQSKQIIIAV